jgi:coproporphyrinogen III oxidase
MEDRIWTRRERAAEWFAALRDRICGEFEAIEDEFRAGGPGAASSAATGSARAAAAARWR